MRIVQYNKHHEEMLERVARDFNIDPDKLWLAYLNTMHANYEQDLWDIANENEEELKWKKKGE